jgi:AcrR family transcriptional regulator
VAKVAAEAGMSTRTIYNHYNNKADLFSAVISALINRLTTQLVSDELQELEPGIALRVIARAVQDRAFDPHFAALFRLTARES